MAKTNSTKKGKASAKRVAPRSNPLRISQSSGFPLNLKSPVLRDLMTEQSRAPWGYATYYLGTQAQLVKAGVPEYLFPTHGRAVAINASEHEGTLQRKGEQFELCIHWDHNGPGYCGHPAATEIARMIHIAISEWLSCDEERGKPLEKRNFEVPTRKLFECERAVDYRLPSSKRFKWARNFPYSEEVFNATSRLFHAIQNAEIMPFTPATIAYEEDSSEVGETADAQAVLARIAGVGRQGDGSHA